MRRILSILRGAFCASAVLSCAPAPGAEIGRQDFALPLYDAVVPGPPGEALTAYTFIANRDWPAIRLLAQKPLDWSRFGSLALPVENPSDTAFQLLVRIDDRRDANGDDRSLTGTLEIPPHGSGSVILPLDAAPLGMRARPPSGVTATAGDFLVRQVSGSVNLSHVTALHISALRGAVDQRLRLGNPTLRAAGEARRGPLADGFGQAIEGDWPEKVKSVSDLKAKLLMADAETRRLAHEAHAVEDRFGGVDGDTKLAATGFFHVGTIDGRWTLVTPAGHRFFSLGIDAVTSANPTEVGGRTGLFAWLPSAPDALLRYAVMDGAGMVDTYDFTQANIDRGLGSGWPSPWAVRAAWRLKSWGFNTLGAWSAAPVTGLNTTPFVVLDEVSAGVASVPMPGGRGLPDPFDPGFAAAADALAVRMTTPHINDDMLLGYFSGNELPWGSDDHLEQGVAAQVLWRGEESPAKRAMIDGLQRRYASAADFTAAWGLTIAPYWDEILRHRVAWPNPLTDAARRDIGDFQKLFATTYFSTVAEAIKRHDPHHLYLGTRFADAPADVVEACARSCDVLSFNVYGLDPQARASAWRPFAKPVLIGEFHFGSTDRGSYWPGMVEVGGEAQRGPAYAAYVARSVEDPQIVGAHWFQYGDEPLTGRPYDGENGHIGIVAVTDVPYTDFVTAVAAANRRALEAFSNVGRLDLRGTQ